MKNTNIQILLLRLVLGALFISLGIQKIQDHWLSDPSKLTESLTGYEKTAGGLQLQYLQSVAIPYAGIWSKLIAGGEIALGASLVIGLLVRLSSLLGFLMVLNLHAATGNLFSLKFFGSAWAALVAVALLLMIISKAGRFIGLDYYLAKSNSKGFLW